jgi:hypothetical protein
MATHFIGRDGSDSTFLVTTEGGGFAEFERDGMEWIYLQSEGLTDEEERDLEALTDLQLGALHEEAMRDRDSHRWSPRVGHTAGDHHRPPANGML